MWLKQAEYTISLSQVVFSLNLLSSQRIAVRKTNVSSSELFSSLSLHGSKLPSFFSCLFFSPPLIGLFLSCTFLFGDTLSPKILTLSGKLKDFKGLLSVNCTG